jgi:putative hemolysin
MTDPLPGQILLLLLLTLVNAFFSMTEIAVVSLNDSKLRRIADLGDKRAKNLIWLTKKPTRFLSTIQVGITLAGFLSSAFAASNFAERLAEWAVKMGIGIPQATMHTVAVVLITLVLSFFTLVLGELVPKRIAMQSPEKIAMGVSSFIRGVSVVLSPLVSLLTATTNGILRLLRIDPHAKTQEATEEEIRMMISIGQEEGNIAETEKVMIENIFELNNRVASECMTHRTDIVGISIRDKAANIEQIIMENTHSRFPVYEEDLDDVVGILHARDYFIDHFSQKQKTLKELLRPVYMVPESIRADRLLQNMQQNHVQMAIVVDEYGGTSGLVTIENLLEEIVGSIHDEYDSMENSIQKLSANTWRIQGSAALEDVEKALGVELPDEDYDTFGGYIFGQFYVIPEDGSQPEAEVDGLMIKVEKIEDHRVEWALVSRTEQLSENPVIQKEEK